MKPVLDETHDPKVQSWVESANLAGSDFPIQNLPMGVFRRRDAGDGARVGVAIGDRVLDLDGMPGEGLLADNSVRLAANACASHSLNSLMVAGAGPRQALRRRLHAILRQDALASDRQAASRHLIAQSDVEMLLPAAVGDYTDFYASIFHATNVGITNTSRSAITGAHRHWFRRERRSVVPTARRAMARPLQNSARPRRWIMNWKWVFL
jgi:fumarylacetoacetase